MVASRAVEVAPLGDEGVTEQVVEEMEVVVEEMEVVVEEMGGVTEQVEAATVTGMAVVVHEKKVEWGTEEAGSST